MYKLALSVALVLLCFLANAQITYTSVNNSTEQWESTSTWTSTGGWVGSPPTPNNPTNSNANAINVYGYVTVSDPFTNAGLTINNANPVVTVYDTLVINGDVTLGSGASLNVPSGGILIITGNLTLQGSFNLSNGGNIVVGGNLSVTNGTITSSSDFYTFGSSSVSGGGNLNGCTGSSGASCPTTTGGIENATNLSNNDPSLYNFTNGLGLTCGFSNIISASQSLCSGSIPTALTGNQPTGVTYQWQKSTTSTTTGFSNITTSGTANYSPGSLTQTTYYRRLATKSSCTNTSSAVTITINANGTWTGATNTTWLTTTNWCGNAVPTASVDAIIQTGLTNYPVVTNTTAPTCHNLQIQTGASVIIGNTNNKNSTLTVSGGITNDGTITVGNASNSSSDIATLTVTGSVTNTGTFTMVNTNNARVTATIGGDLTVASGGTFILGNATSTSCTLTVSGNIANSGTFSINPSAATAVLNVAGNITANAALTINTTNSNTVVFNGSAQQTVTGGPYTFYNLTVNNSGGNQIVFSNDVTVSNALTLTNGIINLSNNNARTFTIGTSTSNAGTLNYTAGRIINTTITRYVTSATLTNFLFPLGTINYYRPFQFSSTNISNFGTMSVKHSALGTVTTGLGIPDTGGPIVRRQNDSWTITTSPSNMAGTLTIQAGGGGFGTTGTLSDIRLMNQNAAIPGSTHVTATGSFTTDLRANRSGVAVATLTGGALYIGSTSNSTALPITLTSFAASNITGGIQLEWSTASELNFDYFSLQKSADGKSFNEIAQVKGHGSTNERHDYSYEDTYPLIGKNYYRLTSVDFDNYRETFDVVVLDYSGGKDFQVSPNPSDGRTIKLNFNFDSNEGQIAIYDNMGSFVDSFQVDETGEVSFVNNLKNGIYFVRYSSPSFTKAVRFLVKQ